MTLIVTALTSGAQGKFTRPFGIGLGTYDFNFFQQQPLTNGTGPNQADLLYQSDPPGRVLAPSASENIDLSGLFPDALGDTILLAKVKVFILYARVENPHDIIVGGGTNPFLGWNAGGTETVPPDGQLHRTNRVAGWPVTAGTGDIIKIANAGAVSPVTYDILIIGTSA